jgi:hypothetical protein
VQAKDSIAVINNYAAQKQPCLTPDEMAKTGDRKLLIIKRAFESA